MYTKIVEMRGIEPRAFHMQSERSTTELHPLAWLPILYYNNPSLYNFKRFRNWTVGLTNIMWRIKCHVLVTIVLQMLQGYSESQYY